jgi:quercetin dioxygenase-like cupin family protein
MQPVAKSSAIVIRRSIVRPKDAALYVSCEDYHGRIKQAYRGVYRWALNKKNALMAKVLYAAPHLNEAERGIKRGAGNDWATWVFSEEPGTEERIFESGLELMIDARLEPGTAIGLHRHDATEEVYYLLEGSLEMTTVGPGGEEHTETLEAGDAHFVRIGQGHYGRSGPDGARFIAVAARKPGAK